MSNGAAVVKRRVSGLAQVHERVGTEPDVWGSTVDAKTLNTDLGDRHDGARRLPTAELVGSSLKIR
ncbi:MAG: hypothetical protein OXC06_04035 [Acidimicrobiaceae bacterium]|nr:hypothetical protein [Acidimicrobiaceae bacterium]